MIWIRILYLSILYQMKCLSYWFFFHNGHSEVLNAGRENSYVLVVNQFYILSLVSVERNVSLVCWDGDQRCNLHPIEFNGKASTEVNEPVSQVFLWDFCLAQQKSWDCLISLWLLKKLWCCRIRTCILNHSLKWFC